MKNTKFLVKAAVIGTIYAVLTILLAPISYGPLQIRISEAMTILPYFTFSAVPGLFLGCIIANFYGVITGASLLGIFDIIFGSLATLIAAYLSYKFKKKWLVPFPPVIINAIIIGFMLFFALVENKSNIIALLPFIGWVFLGQAIACYLIGYPLLLLLEKYKDKIFKN